MKRNGFVIMTNAPNVEVSWVWSVLPKRRSRTSNTDQPSTRFSSLRSSWRPHRGHRSV